MHFVKAHTPTTDIFCFQEIFASTAPLLESRGVRTHLYEELTEALPDFQGFFAAEQDGFDFEGRIDFPISTGNAIFVRRTIPVPSWGDFFVYLTRNGARDVKHFPQNVVYARLTVHDTEITVANLHGIPQPGHKLDTSERLEQSRRIQEFFAKERGSKILCGDFNLLPGTQSLAILKENMHDLVAEFTIERTRSRLSPFFGKPDFQEFSDYIFVSPDIHATRLEVPDVQISDHLPLILEFR